MVHVDYMAENIETISTLKDDLKVHEQLDRYT